MLYCLTKIKTPLSHPLPNCTTCHHEPCKGSRSTGCRGRTRWAVSEAPRRTPWSGRATDCRRPRRASTSRTACAVRRSRTSRGRAGAHSWTRVPSGLGSARWIHLSLGEQWRRTRNERLMVMKQVSQNPFSLKRCLSIILWSRVLWEFSAGRVNVIITFKCSAR